LKGSTKGGAMGEGRFMGGAVEGGKKICWKSMCLFELVWYDFKSEVSCVPSEVVDRAIV